MEDLNVPIDGVNEEIGTDADGNMTIIQTATIPNDSIVQMYKMKKRAIKINKDRMAALVAENEKHLDSIQKISVIAAEKDIDLGE